MSGNYQRGDLTGVSWLPQQTIAAPQTTQPAGNAIMLTVREHDLDLESLLFDTTNRMSYGSRSRIAGPQDASCTVLAVHDADNPVYLAAGGGIVNGGGGLLLFFITPTISFQVPMRIAKLHWKSGTETEVLYNFDAKMDSRVGMLVYPAS